MKNGFNFSLPVLFIFLILIVFSVYGDDDLVLNYSIEDMDGDKPINCSEAELSINNHILSSLLVKDGRIDAIAYLGQGVVLCGTRYPNPGYIFKSTDFGQSWVNKGNITGRDKKEADITCIVSAGAGKAYLLTGNVHIWKTENYGESWIDLGKISEAKNTEGAALAYGLIVLDNGTILVSDANSSGGHVFRSEDNGVTWTDSGCISDRALYRFQKTRDGVILNGWSGHIYKSTDDGLTWQDKGKLIDTALFATESLEGGILLQGSGGIADPDNGVLFRSTDDGETWSKLTVTGDGADDFAYLGNGVVLYSTYNRSKSIYLSKDFGINWHNIGTVMTGIEGDHLDHVVFIEDQKGRFIVGGTSKGFIIYKKISSEHSEAVQFLADTEPACVNVVTNCSFDQEANVGKKTDVKNAPLVEQAIPASQVKAGASILRYEATDENVLTGFYARLSNAIGPVEKPTIIGISVDGQLLQQQLQIPVYTQPLRLFTATGGKMSVPLDVAQEYRIALKDPIVLKPGKVIRVKVLDTEPLKSGLTAGLQFQGVWNLMEVRNPFREVRGSGPISRANWSPRELVVTGTQVPKDPLCAPQNNSGIVSDPDGTLYQFTAFYSIDEQFGNGRMDSYSRIYTFRRKPNQQTWEHMGLLLDPVPLGLTYAGDPFAFRDLQGRPCLVYTTVDGTRGFSDWQHIDARIIRSKTNSFAGPWSPPLAIFEGLAGNTKNTIYKYDNRVNCLRIYPRVKQNDYLIVWIHGQSDISLKGVLVDDLTVKLSHEQVLNATLLARNQEEGGGGFVRGNKGYLSTWQIPSINDPTSIQRLYEFDLDDPLNPEKWTIVPGSCGWTDPRNPLEDGGPTADSWSLSYLPEKDELWATMVVWSAEKKKNSILACNTLWDRRQDSVFHFGVPDRIWSSNGKWQEVTPVVEYALGRQCCLKVTLTGYGSQSYLRMGIAPSPMPLLSGSVCVEVTDEGTRLIFINTNHVAQALTEFSGSPYVSGRSYSLEFIRDNWKFSAKVNGELHGPIVLDDPVMRQYMGESLRFKFHGHRGGYYELSNMVLTDGQSP